MEERFTTYAVKFPAFQKKVRRTKPYAAKAAPNITEVGKRVNAILNDSAAKNLSQGMLQKGSRRLGHR